MSGVTSRGPFEWPQDVFGCKRAFFRKCLFSLRKIAVLEGRVALGPPPRAISTGLRSCYPWETPLPHSTQKSKNVFFDFLLSSLFSLLSSFFKPSSSAALSFRAWSFLAAVSASPCALPSSVHQAIDCAPNCCDPVRFPPWPGGMREAIK